MRRYFGIPIDPISKSGLRDEDGQDLRQAFVREGRCLGAVPRLPQPAPHRRPAGVGYFHFVEDGDDDERRHSVECSPQRILPWFWPHIAWFVSLSLLSLLLDGCNSLCMPFVSFSELKVPLSVILCKTRAMKTLRRFEKAANSSGAQVMFDENDYRMLSVW